MPTNLAAPLTAITLSALVLGGCGWEQYRVTEHRVWQLDEQSPLAVEIGSKHGSVSVAPHGTPLPSWAEDELFRTSVNPDGVLIVAQLRSSDQWRLDEVLLSPELAGDQLRLKAEWPGRGKDGVSYAVRVPQSAYAADVQTGHGSILIESIISNVTIDSGHGSISVSDIGGDLNAHSGHGGFDITGVGGNVEIYSGHGSLGLRDIAGTVDARTGHSSIRVSDSAGPLNLRTGHGSISIDRRGPDTAPIVARTGHGSISVRTETPLEQGVAATTGHGRVYLDLPSGGRIDAKRSAKVTSDAGETAHSLVTGHGSISVKVERADAGE
ncbi:MAG: hypothetical protein AAGI17_05585 [Planctomycetota bacterium]